MALALIFQPGCTVAAVAVPVVADAAPVVQRWTRKDKLQRFP